MGLATLAYGINPAVNSTFDYDYVPLAYNVTEQFAFKSLSLDMTITATENFRVDFASVFAVDFDVSLIGHTYYVSESVTASRSALRISSSGTSPTIGSGSRTVAPVLDAYRPGDILEMVFTYEDYEPLESTVLSVYISNGALKLPVALVAFNTSNSGSGEVPITWTVPTAPFESTDIWHVIVTASNFPARKVASPQSFHLLASNTTVAPEVLLTLTASRRKARHTLETVTPPCGGDTPSTLGFDSSLLAGKPAAKIFPDTSFEYVLASSESNYPVPLSASEICVEGAYTSSPTTSPTESPTAAPTRVPTVLRTVSPTESPTTTPTVHPTIGTTQAPTYTLTATPTAGPTELPTAAPSVEVTARPTVVPTFGPTATPTYTRTANPTAGPTELPTTAPSVEVTARPTVVPTSGPTKASDVVSFKVQQVLFSTTSFNHVIIITAAFIL